MQASAPMNNTWREALDALDAYLAAKGCLPSTIRLRRLHAAHLARDFPEAPWTLTTGQLLAWLRSHEWDRSTVRSYRSTLSTLYAAGVASGLTVADPTSGFPAMKGKRPSPHPTPDDVLDAALERATEREALILLLAARCGLRRGEIAQVRGDDVIRAPGGWCLIVRGKGDKQRTVPIGDDIARAITLRGQGWAFPGDDGGHLSPDWVGVMASRILPGRWTLHSLRHRYATRAFAGTSDLLTVQRMLGHASVATTQGYVDVPDDAMRRAMLAAS